jgi:hypothetical protein
LVAQTFYVSDGRPPTAVRHPDAIAIEESLGGYRAVAKCAGAAQKKAAFERYSGVVRRRSP